MNKPFPKPSKKIVSLLIVVVAIIASILVIKYKQDHPFTPSSLSYSVTDINTFNSANGEDAATQNLNNLLGIDNSTSSDVTGTGNVSDLVAKSLYTGVESLSQSGDTSADSQQSLVSGIAAAAAKNFTYKIYTAENLKLLSLPTKENVKFFASAVASIQNNILAGMAKESSGSGNVKLENIAKIYNNAAKSVYDLPVPVDIANTTLGIVNNYSIAASVYNTLANADQDPVKAATALGYLQQANQYQTDYVNTLARYFKYSGIIFTNDEVGSYWNDFGSAGQGTNSTAQ